MVTGYVLLNLFNNEKRSISEVLVTNRTVIHLFSVEIHRTGKYCFSRVKVISSKLYTTILHSTVNITVR